MPEKSRIYSFPEGLKKAAKAIDWRRLAILAFVPVYFAVAVVLVWSALGKPLVGVDDANIGMVYAKNIIAGNGIVYSAGQERVEGFSDPLTLGIYCLFFLIWKEPEMLLMALNFIFVLCSAYLILNSIRKTAETAQAGKLVYYFLAFSFLAGMVANPAYFARNILSLMDNGIYSFLIVLGFVFLVDLQQEKKSLFIRSIQLSGLILLVILSRPEGVAWAAIFLAIYFAKAGLRNSTIPALSFFATITALESFRLLYFGYPLPNTYYAKVFAPFQENLSNGLQYLASFCSNYWPLFMLTAVSFVVLFGAKKGKWFKPSENEITIVFIFILVGLAMPVFEGGDIFNDFRMYQNIYPLLLLPAVYLALALARYFTPAVITGAFILVNLLFFGFTPAGWDMFYRNNQTDFLPADLTLRTVSEYYIASGSRENGRRLNLIFKGQLPAIGYGSAGGIAFAYKGIVYDMMGLNNTRMAHADAARGGFKAHKFSKTVFYELAPAILMPTAVRKDEGVELERVKAYYSDPANWGNFIFRDIFNDDEFKGRYTLALIANRRDERYRCYGFFNNRFLAGLSDSDNFIIEKVLKY